MARPLRRLLLPVLAVLPIVSAAHELDAAGAAFTAALDEAQRADATWPFTDAERTDVHYAPLGLDGLRHSDLEGAALEAGERLLAATLSEAGQRRVRHVRELEAVIREQENALMRVSGLRDPGRYFWALFGEPDRASPWGYRYEGHHLSLNITVTPDGVATTPLFIGAQPRVVPEGLDVGPPAGTAVLGEEERLARALYAALDDDQRRRATLVYEADRGLMIGQVARIDSTRPVGVARRDLTPAQQALLDALLDGLAALWADELAAARRADIDAARDGLHFAHVEADTPPNSFYTRVAAPSLLVEIDNTEGGDHLHAVWHQRNGDFADDLLVRHLAEDHRVRLVRR